MRRNGYDKPLGAFQAAFQRVEKHLRIDTSEGTWRTTKQKPEGRRLAALALTDLGIATLRMAEENQRRLLNALRMRSGSDA